MWERGYMTEAIRVLHVFGTTNLGGAESRVMDIYRTLDKSKVQFDFIVHTDKECHYDREIIEMGGRIFRVPPFRVYNILSYKRAFKRLFKQHPEFQAVHGHMTSTAAIYLPIANKFGIPTIAHARSAGVDSGFKGYLTRFLRKNLANKTDFCFACSKLAGEAVYGEEAVLEGKVKILPNTINAKKYEFSEEKQKEYRKKLRIEDKTVIGHVGRFHPCKNHEFLLKVFAEYHSVNQNSVLMLVGQGEEMGKIKSQANQLQLQEDVLFLGNRKNVEDYYRVMDYFVFPSFYEGMPGTVIEAQASGLPCLVSDRITEEVGITELVTFMSIDEEPSVWSEYLLRYTNKKSRERYQDIVDAGFDVQGQAKWYEQFYCSLK